jgi:ribosome assembly protein YihI (activator of Der GTPase)
MICLTKIKEEQKYVQRKFKSIEKRKGLFSGAVGNPTKRCQANHIEMGKGDFRTGCRNADTAGRCIRGRS